MKEKTRFLHNTAWILAERGVHILLTLFTTSLTLRYLGAEGAGIIDYGASFLTIFTILCRLGIDAILVNELVRGDHPAGALLGTTVGLRLLAALLSIGAVAALVAVLRPGLLPVALIQSLALLPVALDSLDYYFQSRLQSRYTAWAKSLAFLLVCGFRLTLIALKAPLYWFAGAAVVDAAFTGACLWLFYRRRGERLRFSGDTARHLLPRSAPFILSALLVTLYTQMDSIMLGSLAAGEPERAIGLYNAAAKVCNLWVFLPLAVIDSARPLIMAQKGVDEGAYRTRYRRLYAALIWLGIAAGVGISFLAPVIISLIAGGDFAGATPVLRVLIWSRLFATLGTARGIFMVCEGHRRLAVVFAAVGAAVNFALNIALIPPLGAMGAAMATLITEALVAVVLPLCFAPTRPPVKWMAEGLFGRGIK